MKNENYERAEIRKFLLNENPITINKTDETFLVYF